LALGFTPAGIGEEFLQKGGQSLKPLAQPLQQSAENIAGQILAPTTKFNKALTEKITPKFIEKSPFAFSLKGLVSKAEKNIGKFGEQIGAKFEALPPESRDSLVPIFRRITQAQDALAITGTNHIPSTKLAQHDALSNLKNELVTIAGNSQSISTPTLRHYLQELSNTVASSKAGYAFKPMSEQATLSAQRTVSDVIRDEMAKSRPDINVINKEYTFWKDLQKIAKDTVDRKRGQVGGVRKVIAQAGGEAAGASIGGVPGAMIGGYVGNKLQGFLDSPAFKFINMSVKSKAADYIASGRPDKAVILLQRALPKTKSVYLQKDKN